MWFFNSASKIEVYGSSRSSFASRAAAPQLNAEVSHLDTASSQELGGESTRSICWMWNNTNIATCDMTCFVNFLVMSDLIVETCKLDATSSHAVDWCYLPQHPSHFCHLLHINSSYFIGTLWPKGLQLLKSSNIKFQNKSLSANIKTLKSRVPSSKLTRQSSQDGTQGPRKSSNRVPWSTSQSRIPRVPLHWTGIPSQCPPCTSWILLAAFGTIYSSYSSSGVKVKGHQWWVNNSSWFWGQCWAYLPVSLATGSTRCPSKVVYPAALDAYNWHKRPSRRRVYEE